MKTKNSKRMRAGKRSQNRGRTFERTIANDLEERYGDMSLPMKDRFFRRCPMSGGFRTGHPGDLVVPDWFPFVIEAKSYKTAEGVLDLTTIPQLGSKHKLLQWWDQESKLALACKKALLIVFSKGRNKMLALGSFESLGRLDLAVARGVTGDDFAISIRNRKYDLVCVSYTTLFNRQTKDTLSQYANYLKNGSAVALEKVLTQGAMGGTAVAHPNAPFALNI